jgi:hypothetical protein
MPRTGNDFEELIEKLVNFQCKDTCGTERRKLKIWGMKKSSRVWGKWPIIPATAIVIPAK